VENFFVVQCVKLRKHATIADTRTNTELSALSTVKPPSSMSALRSMRRRSLESTHGKIAYHASKRKTCGQRFARHRKRRSLSRKAGAENERPVRGDNRTGQAIWALGVDGRSRRIQPMGRDYRSHIDKSQHPRRTFKTPGDFFNPVFGAIAAKIAAQHAILRRLWPISPTPSTAGSHSTPGSRKRYRQTGRAPAFFLPLACRKPRQAELPARPSPQ
jgi:hypothetical protein